MSSPRSRKVFCSDCGRRWRVLRPDDQLEAAVALARRSGEDPREVSVTTVVVCGACTSTSTTRWWPPESSWVMCLVALLMLSASVSAQQAPLIIGHRGASGVAPENTLAAIERAWAEGADAVEFDLMLTADGQAVLMHDLTLDRTTSGAGPVGERTLEQLRTLDAGYTDEFGDDYQGERIPTLDEALRVARGRGGIVLDLKTTDMSEHRIDLMARRIAEALERHAMSEQVLLGVWTAEDAAIMRRHLPHIALIHIYGDLSDADARSGEYFWEARRAGFDALSYNLDTLTPAFVRNARLRALPVYAWTVNEPDAVRRAVTLGVDGIITDFPARTRAEVDGLRRQP